MVTSRAAAAGCAALVGLAVLSACGTRASTVSVDGSSTVFPLTAVAAEEFQAKTPGIRVRVGTSGTVSGFERLCRGEIDANDASRQITPAELDACGAAGIQVGELAVAIDAITVIVNRANTWAECLTTDQLRSIWQSGSHVTFWDEVDPAYPHERLSLYGPGTSSGTFDYFTQVINGAEGASRTDYAPAEDDHVTVQGVAGSVGGLGYLGYTYFDENRDRLRAVSIDHGDGCTLPSPNSVQSGRYAPLARPLFVYPSVRALSEPHVRAFFDYYVGHDLVIAQDAGFIPLNADQRQQLRDDYAALLNSATEVTP